MSGFFLYVVLNDGGPGGTFSLPADVGRHIFDAHSSPPPFAPPRPARPHLTRHSSQSSPLSSHNMSGKGRGKSAAKKAMTRSSKARTKGENVWACTAASASRPAVR